MGIAFRNIVRKKKELLINFLLHFTSFPSTMLIVSSGVYLVFRETNCFFAHKAAKLQRRTRDFRRKSEGAGKKAGINNGIK
jgi:hypothetical protein